MRTLKRLEEMARVYTDSVSQTPKKQHSRRILIGSRKQ